MRTEELHKVGKYGSIDTCIDENNSSEIVERIFDKLYLRKDIPGYRFNILRDGISEELLWKRDNLDVSSYNGRTIKPDSPTIILQEKKNLENFYIVLSCEDKYQETSGNAIERTSKNFNFFHNHLTNNCDINPYVLFIAGPAFFSKNKLSPNEYFVSKFREMLPYIKEGKPRIWYPSESHSIYKSKWDLIFLQEERFSQKQKEDILTEVAFASVDYYQGYLKNISSFVSK